MEKQTLSQKSLLFLLYALIILSIVLSVLAVKNIGQAGYDRCIQEKCEERGEEFCSKFREINNCCQGADGQVSSDSTGYICVFD